MNIKSYWFLKPFSHSLCLKPLKYICLFFSRIFYKTPKILLFWEILYQYKDICKHWCANYWLINFMDLNLLPKQQNILIFIVFLNFVFQSVFFVVVYMDIFSNLRHGTLPFSPPRSFTPPPDEMLCMLFKKKDNL